VTIDEVLAHVPIFATLDPEELVAVKQALEKKVYAENAVVFEEKAPGDGLYIVAIGAVKIVKNIDAGNRRALAGFIEGDFFGEMALLDGKPRSAGAVTTRPSVLFRISVEHFNQLMHSAPFAALKIVSQIACFMAMRMREIDMRLAELENFRLLRE